jgi:hypothetical protein
MTFDPYDAPRFEAAPPRRTRVFSSQGLMASVAMLTGPAITIFTALTLALGVLDREMILASEPFLRALMILVGLGAPVAFLVWQYHVVLNLRRFARVGVTWSPAQAGVLWFVPFLNLVHGYRVMSEVWRASDPTQVGREDSWKGNPTPSIIGWWWAACAGMVILGWALRGSSTLADFFLDGVLRNVAAVLAIVVIRKIDARHTAFAAAREAWLARQERKRVKAKLKLAAASSV